MPILTEKHRFTTENVDLAPDLAGVYALYVDGEVSFYGAARGGETLRWRLSQHLQGHHPPGREGAKLFNFEVTRFPLSRERALLEEFRRIACRMPRFNEVAPSPNRRDLRREAEGIAGDLWTLAPVDPASWASGISDRRRKERTGSAHRPVGAETDPGANR